MNKLDLNYLRDLLTQVGREALMGRFHHPQARLKADGSLLTDADLDSQCRIRAALGDRWPEIGFLGEEMTVEEQVAALGDGGPLWVLDPLDGTTNFAVGLPFFGISLALLVQDEVRLGLVLDPVREECFWAQAGQGAWLNEDRLRLSCEIPATLEECVALVDYKRLPHRLACALVCQPPFRSQRSLGSVALEWCWLAAGRGNLYLHGGQRLWDFAAGRLILREAGGAVWQDQGNPLDLRQQPAVAAGNSRLLAQWKRFLDTAPGHSL
jgi:myo-inositol-1(or 4)-monophosphatase